MGKEEEIHYKAVIAADNQEPPKDYAISAHADHFNGFVEGFVEGYHQAEKDLELTLEDLLIIDKLFFEVNLEIDYGSMEFWNKVLKRFKDLKR